MSQKRRSLGGSDVDRKKFKSGEAEPPLNLQPAKGNLAAGFAAKIAAALKKKETEGRAAQVEDLKSVERVTSASQIAAPVQNPYLAPVTNEELDGPRERRSKPLRFVKPGTYIEQQQQLDQMEAFEKAQRERDERELAEQLRQEADPNFMNPVLVAFAPSPRMEWWDQAYEEAGGSSSLTSFMQHPIEIPDPDSVSQIVLPAMLSSKEMKKMRKVRREEEMREKQDRIKMGLLPPEPEKLKLKHFMKNMAGVTDPTQREREIRLQMAARERAHVEDNEARKVDKQDKHEKELQKQKVSEATSGTHGAAWRVKYLSHPLHKAKVKNNAQQLHLTGRVLSHLSFALVFVEGEIKAIKAFTALMERRIKWRRDPDEENEGEEDMDDGEGEGHGRFKDNECRLVWSGPLRQRQFHNFRPALCPTDAVAKSILGDDLASIWDVAKRDTAEVN